MQDISLRSLHVKLISAEISKDVILPKDVLNKIDEIYNSMDGTTYKGAHRKQLYVMLIYKASRQCGINVDPYVLGKTFSLTQQQVTRAHAMFPTINCLSNSYGSQDNVVNLIRSFCSEKALGFSEEHIQQIITLSHMLFTKPVVIPSEKPLRDEAPHTCAAGLIAFYAKISGIDIPDENMRKVSGRSLATIEAILKKIEIVYNTPITPAICGQPANTCGQPTCYDGLSGNVAIYNN